ncbi:hypothetical protein GFS24_06605 [Chitinophaga sp. SYP-B3965]|uniref:prenyltransferase/squalene oxidase repeat-containing protein n=1 Tax=Chitinophaga sp. SYP-B3965 TaxID=2663120 RepID=UPI0012998884|nr:prenyltransferase/squalene oxidase repeat-containing protein [Chitinophaga sp. SYP-B3965]MRG44776.1 hypothetical protein [Chitinophaga sp. SYP-B3965]
MNTARYAKEALIEQSTYDLREHLSDHVSDSGGIQERCNSRALESALMLRLLQQENMYPQVQTTIIRFLHARYNAPDLSKIEQLLIDVSLGKPITGDASISVMLADFRHFTSSRKRLMFETYLAVLEAVPYNTTIDPSLLEYHGYASWVGLTLCAIKILNAYGQGRAELVTSEDKAFLIEQLTGSTFREVWECHFSCHLLALLALHKWTPGHPVIRNGINNMLRHSNPDGGLPFIPDMTVFLTTLAGTALAKTGARPALLQQMADYITLLQTHKGGWPYTEGVQQTDVDDTCCAVEFLRIVDAQRYAEPIAAATNFLINMVNTDGGFPTYQHGHPSEVTMTANAIIALAPDGERYAKLLQAAITFLYQQQQLDGSFERSWSLSETYAIARVTSALKQVPPRYVEPVQTYVDHLLEKLLHYLVNAQHADGGWGHKAGGPSDVISTAHAMTAVAQLNGPVELQQGWHYLLQHQDANGGFRSIPDQAAPRPIPYDFPVLADIFVLNAFGMYQSN